MCCLTFALLLSLYVFLEVGSTKWEVGRFFLPNSHIYRERARLGKSVTEASPLRTPHTYPAQSHCTIHTATATPACASVDEDESLSWTEPGSGERHAGADKTSWAKPSSGEHRALGGRPAKLQASKLISEAPDLLAHLDQRGQRCRGCRQDVVENPFPRVLDHQVEAGLLGFQIR